MATEERRPFLVPRQVVAQVELAAGVGPAEAAVIAAGAAAGGSLQWVLGVVLRLVGVDGGGAILARAGVGLLLGASGWIMTRPTPGGRIMDYVGAMVRYYRRGDAPHLYGPPAS